MVRPEPKPVGSVALVFNPTTGHVSPQYHVVFDDDFSTVSYMEEGTVPPNWADLVSYSSEHASSQDYILAETWLNHSSSKTGSSPADNPVVDPFAIVTHDQNKGNKNGTTQNRSRSNEESVAATNCDVVTHMADSEGEHSTIPSQSKRKACSADTACANTQRDSGGMEAASGFNANTASPASTQDNLDELRMPTKINLYESGLRRSPRLTELREAEQSKAKKQKAHVPYGTRLSKKVLGLLTIISLVSEISLPKVQVSSNATLTDRIVRRFEEANEHYDGTVNEMHLFSYLTDVSTNEVFTLRQAMKEDDRMDFVAAMEKEIRDHEERGHWTIVDRASLPSNAKPIKAIWSFKRKRRPDGSLLKHKARLCAHGGMQQWGDNYWETYSPVVNMLSVRLLLSIAKIYKLESKAIDFVLAFPQADLDVDIWMYQYQQVSKLMDKQKKILTGIKFSN